MTCTLEVFTRLAPGGQQGGQGPQEAGSCRRTRRRRPGRGGGPKRLIFAYVFRECHRKYYQRSAAGLAELISVFLIIIRSPFVVLKIIAKYPIIRKCLLPTNKFKPAGVQAGRPVPPCKNKYFKPIPGRCGEVRPAGASYLPVSPPLLRSRFWLLGFGTWESLSLFSAARRRWYKKVLTGPEAT
jgi:hypothetical protein